MIGLIVGIVLVLGIVGFLVLSNNESPSNEELSNPNQTVDCGKMDNPSCFSNRMSGCLPVKAQPTGTGGSDIEIIILGYVNGSCHFQREINSVPNMDCYFPNGSLTWDLIDQTFGNDKGLQSVVDQSCKQILA